MKGKIVKHKTLGEGKITKVEDGYVAVTFAKGTEPKTFKYPDAFKQFLAFQDEKLQEKAVEQFTSQQDEKKQQNAEKQQAYVDLETERREKRQELARKKRKEVKSKAIRDKEKRLQANLEDAKQAEE